MDTHTVAQTFLNGSFETTSAPAGCNYNLSNGAFNGYMSNTVAYGPGNEVDISTTGCFAPSVPHGIRFISLAALPSDEVSMQLSAPLTAGSSYTFTFWHRGDLARPLGALQVGLSNTATSFGTLIYTSPVPTTAWTQRTVSFTAPVSGAFITLRNINDGMIHWNFVDDYRFPTPLGVPDIDFELTCDDNQVQLQLNATPDAGLQAYVFEKKAPESMEFVELERITDFTNSLVSYMDRMDIPGMHYYRIAMLDHDGGKTYSDQLVCAFSGQDEWVFPNPTTDWIYFGSDIAYVEVYDMNGKLEMRSEAVQSGLSLSELVNGVYLVSCYDKAGFNLRILVTKE